MPGTDGYELLRKVRALSEEQNGRIPAVALTGYAADRDRGLAAAAGYQMHLPKPVDPAELTTALARLAGRGGPV
jgi:CheY-like chemotaxis protein